MASFINDSEARLLLKLGASDPSSELMAVLISTANEMATTYLNWRAAGEYTEIIPGGGTDSIVLKAAPVSSITSVTVDDVPITGWRLDEPNGILYRPYYGWPPIISGYKIIYTGGKDTVPTSIKYACALIISALMASDANGGQQVISEQIGDYRAAYARIQGRGLESFCPAAASILEPYRDRHF